MARTGDDPVLTAPAAPPASFATRWGGRGFVTDLGGPVHWVDFGGPSGSSAPPMVLVHGLGGSHLNWVQVAPALAAERRVLAVDLAGFGLTPAAGRSAAVQSNAALLGRFVREVAGSPAVLAGNSMGGMISILHAHAEPAAVAGLVLVDPSIPVPRQRPDLRVARSFALYATPGLGELYLTAARSRTTPRQQVERVLELCFADPQRASAEVTEASAELAGFRRTVPGTERAFLQAARSLAGVLARPGRYRAMMAGLPMPVLLIHGEQDRLVPVAAARDAAAAFPGWDVTLLPGVGHTPQLEAPGEVVAAIRTWAGRHRDLTARPGPERPGSEQPGAERPGPERPGPDR
jgi:pimeloyl-ACP methyl ester carboxylesterase